MFVRLVSHEIRTPLNIVLSGLKILKGSLQHKTDDPEVFDIIHDCEVSCDTAVDILSELLAYEKIDAGVMTLEKTVLPVWKFIDTTIRPFRVQVYIYFIDDSALRAYLSILSPGKRLQSPIRVV